MNDKTSDKLIQGYNRMMERVREGIEQAESRALPVLREAIEKARQTAVELEELSHDEAQKVAAWLKRDLQDAGRHLAESREELADWLRFDLELIEDSLLEVFSRVADRTRLEWEQLQAELESDPPYHTGEVTGPGTLYCAYCNEELHFHHTARIPPCPRCHGTTFRRLPVDPAPADQGADG